MDPKQFPTCHPPESDSDWENYRPPIPDTSHLITETDEPVDNIFSEKQMRLLTEPLYTSWNPGRPFWVAANVGMYEALNAAEAIVPDVLLSLDTSPDTAHEYGSKCYFFWDHGKPPEVVIEIVSNKKGRELDKKLERYAKLHIDHYLVFDPDHQLTDETLQSYSLTAGKYKKRPRSDFFTTVSGLGLRLWQGEYEGQEDCWLRWYDCQDGDKLIATGIERAASEAQRADAETQRANAEAQRSAVLANKLRELGVDPDSL